MFIASFKNKNMDEINFIYKDIDNKFIGVNINKDGVGDFDYHSLNYFIKNVKFNDRCIKIDNDNDYDIYYNPFTNYKHYIKDDKEDFLMFYLKNGNDALLYKENYKNKKDKKNKFKNFIFDCVYITCFSLLWTYLLNNPVWDIIDYKIYSNDRNISYESVINYDNISIDDYINKIMKCTNLTEEEKELLANEQLLKDITPYYNDTYMEKLINIKMNDIDIEFYPAEKHTDRDGYYSFLQLNILHLSDRYKYPYDIDEVVNRRKEVTVHEYIHLLQSYYEYHYIQEAVTEIIKNEYYDMHMSSYHQPVNNIKLLIDIIGPEPILKSSFGGDSKELENILADNLSLDDYKKLMFYFRLKPVDIDENKDKEIRELLCNLYKNMYGRDITVDEDILYDLFYTGKYEFDNNKIYLNKSKMEDIEEYEIYVKGSKEELCEKGLIKIVEKKIVQKNVSYEEYRDLVSQNKGINCVWDYDSSIVKSYNDKYLINDTDIVTFEDAVNLGYIVIYYIDSFNNDEKIPKEYKHIRTDKIYTTNFDSLKYYCPHQDSIVFFLRVNGLKSRFNINYDFDKNKGIHM